MALKDSPVGRETVSEGVVKKTYSAPVLEVLDADSTATGALGAQVDGTNTTTATAS